jgi:3-hydroxyacyl-CoA dehydrogenase
MFARRDEQIDAMLMEGATIAQLDRVIFDFGFPMGPYVLGDLIGNDLFWNREESTGSTINEIVCEMGRYGLKSGMGYYKYEEGSRVPIPDPEIDKLVAELAAKQNITRREVTDTEILERSIYILINEGAKILEEGIAQRPSDIDVIWVNGYGWPVYLGGPMFYADLIGLDNIVETLKKYSASLGESLKPAPLLVKLAAEGKGFKDLG